MLFGKPEQDNNTDVPATDANGFGIPELEADTVETGALTPFGGPYDIAPGSTAPTTVADCLDAGIPVWIGTSVGQAFQELEAGQIGQPADPSDPTAGGHAMAILGYRTGPGKLQFLVRNSWGPGWCEGGNCWVSAAFIATAWSLLPFEVT